MHDQRYSTSSGLAYQMGVRFALFTIILNVILSAAYYAVSYHLQEKELRKHILAIAGAAAAGFTPDESDSHDLIISEKDETSDTYGHLKKKLQRIKASLPDIQYIYTLRKLSGGKLEFVIDAETDPQEVSHAGDIYDDASKWLRFNFSKFDKPAIEPEISTDKWGASLSGFAPLIKSDGTWDTVVGVDVSAEEIYATKKSFLLLNLYVFACTIPLAILVGMMIGRSLARPVATLTQAAKRVADGDFSHKVATSGSKEIRMLAQSFNEMTSRLQTSLDNVKNEMNERKTIQEALISERRLFVTGLAIIVKIRNAAGWPVEHISQNISFHFGYQPESFMFGKLDYTGIVHPEDLDMVDSMLRSFIASRSRENIEFEHRIIDASGLTRWVYVFLMASKDAADTINGLHGYVIDITSRKQIERELSQQCENLQQMIEERTAELTDTIGMLKRATNSDRMDELSEERLALAAKNHLAAPIHNLEAASKNLLGTVLTDEQKRYSADISKSVIDISRWLSSVIVNAQEIDEAYFLQSPPMAQSTETLALVPDGDEDGNVSESSFHHLKLLIASNDRLTGAIFHKCMLKICSETALVDTKEALFDKLAEYHDALFFDLSDPVCELEEIVAYTRTQEKLFEKCIMIAGVCDATDTGISDRVYSIGIDEIVTGPFTTKSIRRIVKRMAE